MYQGRQSTLTWNNLFKKVFDIMVPELEERYDV